MKKKGSTALATAFAVAAALGLALPAVAQKSPKTSSSCAGAGGKSYNVTSIIADTDGNANPFQIQSDGGGPYATYTSSKTDTASSIIQGVSCDWVLDLSGSQSRTVGLSLAYADPAGSTLPPGWPTDGSTVDVAARIISKCENNPGNNHVSYGTMTFAGQTLDCPLSLSFYFNGVWYGVRMDPSLFAGTSWARVTCTGATSNRCNAWTVTPIPNTVVNSGTGQSMAIAELIQPSCVGCTSGIPMGVFYVAFSATIHP
jgi:hypothetical protein